MSSGGLLPGSPGVQTRKRSVSDTSTSSVSTISRLCEVYRNLPNITTPPQLVECAQSSHHGSLQHTLLPSATVRSFSVASSSSVTPRASPTPSLLPQLVPRQSRRLPARHLQQQISSVDSLPPSSTSLSTLSLPTFKIHQEAVKASSGQPRATVRSSSSRMYHCACACACTCERTSHSLTWCFSFLLCFFFLLLPPIFVYVASRLRPASRKSWCSLLPQHR